MRIILSLFFLWSVAFSSEFRLKEKFATGEPGSYLVIEQNKTFLFFYVSERSPSSLVFEEVSIPAANRTSHPMCWKEWFEKGAPGHTSWIMSQVNLETGSVDETFSFTHRGWINLPEANSFLVTLLNLRFQEVPESERRRIGLPPGYNKVDHRPIWNPRLIVEGKIISDTFFYAYKARWPADGTELSRKTLEIYMPHSSEGPHPYPLYFPYWLEVEGKIGSAKMRVVDSGMGAHSPKHALPKRPPQLGAVKLKEEGLYVELKSPHYYKEFIILAEAEEGWLPNFSPLPCEITYGAEERVSLFVPNAELKKVLTPNKDYHFSISPQEDPSLVMHTHPLKITNQ